LIVVFLSIAVPGRAQSLSELLRQAEANYPLLKAKRLEVQAGESNTAVAKSTAMPSLDAAYQLNLATYNNITGMASTQFLVPMTGPPSASNNYQGVLGSAGSLLLNWEPYTFGQRQSRIDLARANWRYYQADAEQEIFSHQVNVITTYFDVLMAKELINVFRKNLDRTAENARAVRILVRSGMRPGVDTALFNAEFLRAKIELMQYRKYLETREIALSELVAVEKISYTADSSFFVTLPQQEPDSSSSIHPSVQWFTRRLEIQQRERDVVARTLNPKLSAWGTAYGRGSGVAYNGAVNSSDGLSLSRYNYGVGLQLSVPLLRFVEVNGRLRQQQALIRAQEARVDQVKRRLDKAREAADAGWSNALEVARDSPLLYQSAQFSYRSLLTRYKSGLATYADLMQAQYGFVKAEVEYKKSYLDAWRALLDEATVRGDLSLFLNQVK